MRNRVVRRSAFVVAAVAVVVSVVAASGFGQGAGSPLTAVRYSITIDGYEIASFKELSSINLEVEPADYRASVDKEIVLDKLPGKLKPPTITLKRGMTGSLELFAWHEAVRLGQISQARRSASLTAYNSSGVPVARWWLEKAWPSKLEVSALKAGSSEVLTETVTFVAEYLQRVAP